MWPHDRGFRTSLRTGLISAALALLLPAAALALEPSPPTVTAPSIPTQAPRLYVVGIRAVVVRSWMFQYTSLVWPYLNANWSAYGSIPLFIDYTSLSSVASFTYSDLVNSAADVVVVSDPSGGLQQWAPGEIAALQQYANDGHPIVGTYLAFYYSGGGTAYDNRGLAPLFGLSIDANDGPLTDVTESALEIQPSACLFERLGPTLEPGGFLFAQLPSDLSWDPADLSGAVFLARSGDGITVATHYQTSKYGATFISYMPEYQTGTDTESTQLVYNALTCGFGAVPTRSTSWGRIKSIYR
ncbi:MAG: hypothetical protein ACRENS_06950 [Candidatus Eiseniibacteriota bacterium]